MHANLEHMQEICVPMRTSLLRYFYYYAFEKWDHLVKPRPTSSVRVSSTYVRRRGVKVKPSKFFFGNPQPTIATRAISESNSHLTLEQHECILLNKSFPKVMKYSWKSEKSMAGCAAEIGTYPLHEFVTPLKERPRFWWC